MQKVRPYKKYKPNNVELNDTKQYNLNLNLYMCVAFY